MNPQKKPYFSPPHFHAPVDPDLFCPRYRMADRPDLYMWDSMEGTPGSASDVSHHMDNNTDHGTHDTSWQSHLKSWPMNRPPLAHTGPHVGHGPALFPSHHSQPSTPAPPRMHSDMSSNPMGGGSGGMPGTPTPSSVSNATSPLVVPQPIKGRTIKTYHCRMCDQIFESKSDLLVHSQQIHKQDPKPYKCPTCNKCFANSSYLSQHARIHSGIKPYKCQICERRFTQLCHLQQHIRTHTGEKPYKCQHPGCGKAFSQLSNLQSHSRSHMTDKPYRCNSCYKCFSDEQSLREHIPKHSETKHIKTHICRICGKAYTQETYLARHMTKHSGDPYSPQGLMPHRNSMSMQSKMNSGLAPPTPGAGMSHHPGQDQQDVKPPLDMINHGGLSNNKGGPIGASAFMPLAHQFPSPSLMNSTVPSTSFPFGSPRLPNSTLNSPLSHISPSSTSPGYFPFDPITFPKRDPMDSRMSMGMSREDMIANSLISLQQIKNFSSRSHPVFPKSEPSSPVHKDF